MVTQEEMNDVLAIISAQGLIATDFLFNDMDATSWQQAISPVRSHLTISNSKSGKRKEYMIASINSWVLEFQCDLENGFFSNVRQS